MTMSVWLKINRYCGSVFDKSELFISSIKYPLQIAEVKIQKYFYKGHKIREGGSETTLIIRYYRTLPNTVRSFSTLGFAPIFS